MDIHANLKAHGLSLPKLGAPAGAYVGTMQANGLLFVAGQLPMRDGKVEIIGKLGRDLDADQGFKAAEICALNILAQIDAALKGDWSKFHSILRLNGFVNADPDFKDHPKIINGASELMAKILEDHSAHTRIALGASSLPFGAAVEIDAVIALKA